MTSAPAVTAAGSGWFREGVSDLCYGRTPFRDEGGVYAVPSMRTSPQAVAFENEGRAPLSRSAETPSGVSVELGGHMC